MESNHKRQTENEQRVAEEYLSSLADLNCNSKPLINMLTMLAEENIDYAAIIVKVVEQHIAQVPPDFKLPILYLIDSIVKNVKSTYVQLFSQCIVNIFCGVFEMVHEKIRERMYALRQTWNEVFSPQKLYALDVKVKRIDCNWPITAKQPTKPAIHVNPDFLKNGQTSLPSVEEILQVKTRELLELKKRKLELELEQTKKHLEEQEKQLHQTTDSVVGGGPGPTQPQVAATAAGSSAAGAAVNIPPSGDRLRTGSAMVPPVGGILPAGGVVPATVYANPNHFRNSSARQQATAQMVPPQSMIPSLQTQTASGVGIGSGSQLYTQKNHTAAGIGGNKTKVHPVNSALLNSVRQRDPRLARQQQQQKQQQQSQSSRHDNSSKSMSHHRSGSNSNRNKSSRSRSKSPTRLSSSRVIGSSSVRSHKSSSSHHGGSSSSSSRNDKDRKRSESKSSTTSCSSAASSASATAERRKVGGDHKISSAANNTTVTATASRYDVDLFDIESASGGGAAATHKRKSSSPAVSPSKSKRSSKHRSGSSSGSSRNEIQSRSRSPNQYKDVDMRAVTTVIIEVDNDDDDNNGNNVEQQHATTGERMTTATNELEKPIIQNTRHPQQLLISSSKLDIDLRQKVLTAAPTPSRLLATTSTSAASSSAATTTTSATATTTITPSSPPRTTPPPPAISLSAIKFIDSDSDNDNGGDVDGMRPTLAASSLVSTLTSLCSNNPSNNSNSNNKNHHQNSDNNKMLKHFITATSTLTTTTTTSSKNTITISTNLSSTTTSNSYNNNNKNKNTHSKVSFKIQKPFNKLEKSTANSSTAAAATFTSPTSTTTIAAAAAATSASATVAAEAVTAAMVPPHNDSLKASLNKLLQSVNKEQQQKQQQQALVAAEKRPPTAINSGASAGVDADEPQHKRIKSSKIDGLFGSEDVDLRLEILPPKKTPITAAMTSDDEYQQQQQQQAAGVAPPKLSELRAKLAKTMQNQKQNKSEKTSKEHHQAQRLKLAEININEDSQEANDEKVRIILSQAQEMYDTKAITKDQFQDLVHKMMSIHEASKLKEAKRREALKFADTSVNDEPPCEDRERAARDAVLRKRIPKLAKASHESSSGSGNRSNDSPRSDGSPMYDDVDEGGGVGGGGGGAVVGSGSNTTHKSSGGKPNKEKRRKPSKWGDQIVDPAQAQRGAWLANNAASSGNGGQPNASGIGNSSSQTLAMKRQFRSQPVTQILANNKRLVTPMPWQCGPMPQQQPPQPFIVGVGGMPGQMLPAVRVGVPPPPQPPQMIGLPPVPPANIPKPCNSIDNPQADMVRTITIDGTAKEIRIYNQVAIVFMAGDVPHEIGFQPGQRAIIIDNMEPITLQFNDEYKPITIDGVLHHIRFGFPSHELYIDEHWYEVYFGGPPVSIPLRNQLHLLKAEGPPPQVNIGAVRRDLVIGKISMIVDAHTVVSLFLDGKPQTFMLNEQQHSIQFIDSFQNVLLNGELLNVEYGGLPKSVALGNRKYFIRFGTLPPGIIAGKVHVQDMIYIKTEAPSATISNINNNNNNNDMGGTSANDLALSSEMKQLDGGGQVISVARDIPQTEPLADTAAPMGTSAASVLPSLSNLNIDELFQKLVSTGIIGGAAAGAAPILKTQDKTASPTNTAPTQKKPSAVDARVAADAAAAAAAAASPMEPINPINLTKSDSIKTRQTAIIATLYMGMQCSSCGVRFPPEQTIKYSQHLDWHFRQNRRERDSSRKALSRKWYYDLNDWIQYEEIEDVEEREKNFLDAQQNGGPEAIEETSNQRSLGSPTQSCPAGPHDMDRACDMCHEQFEQFYNEELEEWHLRSAIRIEDKFYHPLCYEDYTASLNPSEEAAGAEKENKTELHSDDNAVDMIIKIENDDDKEGDEESVKAIVDDDDDVIVLPNEEPSVTEIMDDDDDDDGVIAAVDANEYVPANVTEEEMGGVDGLTSSNSGKSKRTTLMNDTAAESDVEIQEPNIPFTDLDTYVEKELPEPDEATQAAFLNVKIKEEPRDDTDDEDDGFEDVGTVLITPDDEISIHSSEETQTQTIASSTASPAPTERPPSVSSLSMHGDGTTTLDATTMSTILEHVPMSTSDLNASFEAEQGGGSGNLDTPDEHNLSAAGPAPAIPLASLVNKIKINITKNISNNSHSHSNNSSNNNGSSANASTLSSTSNSHSNTATTSTNSSTVSAISVVGGAGSNDILKNSNSNSSYCGVGGNKSEVNAIQTISTIPVLCGGSTFVPKITTSSSSLASSGGVTPSNISTISVIGSSYSSSSNNGARYVISKPNVVPAAAAPTLASQQQQQQQHSQTSSLTNANVLVSTTPPPAVVAAADVEEEPTIEFKPALRNVTLKKTKKVMSGVETSGLCSIM